MITLQNNQCKQKLADIHELSDIFIVPWISTEESIINRINKQDVGVYTEDINVYPSLSELYRTPAFYDSSAFIRLDLTDSVEEIPCLIDSSSQEDVLVSPNETTCVDNINVANEQFRQYLDSQTKDFVRALKWTDFEDGIENDITRQVSAYIEQNRYVTYCWLNKIFNDNRSMPNITSGLLRTLAMVVDKSDTDIMLSMVVAGIASTHSEDQEAAIMVVEKWRTKDCLDAMLNTSYGSDWVREYAMQVIGELKEELGV